MRVRTCGLASAPTESVPPTRCRGRARSARTARGGSSRAPRVRDTASRWMWIVKPVKSAQRGSTLPRSATAPVRHSLGGFSTGRACRAQYVPSGSIAQVVETSKGWAPPALHPTRRSASRATPAPTGTTYPAPALDPGTLPRRGRARDAPTAAKGSTTRLDARGLRCIPPTRAPNARRSVISPVRWHACVANVIQNITPEV